MTGKQSLEKIRKEYKSGRINLKTEEQLKELYKELHREGDSEEETFIDIKNGLEEKLKPYFRERFIQHMRRHIDIEIEYHPGIDNIVIQEKYDKHNNYQESLSKKQQRDFISNREEEYHQAMADYLEPRIMDKRKNIWFEVPLGYVMDGRYIITSYERNSWTQREIIERHREYSKSFGKKLANKVNCLFPGLLKKEKNRVISSNEMLNAIKENFEIATWAYKYMKIKE